jgi:glycosyltransferase involved in cell wall biosynthesis
LTRQRQREEIGVSANGADADRQFRVCVVGAGTRFLSGISYYTLHLSNELARRERVSAILMRQLLPTWLYPGRARVGKELSRMQHVPAVRVFDGVDWHWLPSIFKALAFLRRERPEIVLLQWWSGTVFHTYLALAIAARLRGARVIVEFHEVLDTAEERLPLVGRYARLIGSAIVRLAGAFVVHSEVDRPVLKARYPLGERPIACIKHGPYDQYRTAQPEMTGQPRADDGCNLLYFGVIRPYKGVEDLIRAFDGLAADEIERYRLTVVGETWEGCTLPGELIERSPYRDRITFVNRYATDEEVAAYFAQADAVVLPYRRSSASGPLHTAMSHGLPVVVTNVGGLPEAVAGYAGALLVPPDNPDALRDALRRVVALRGQRFTDPHSWAQNARRYHALFLQVLGEPMEPETEAGAEITRPPELAGQAELSRQG